MATLGRWDGGDPGLRATPGPGCREVEVDGGCGVGICGGFQDLLQAVAELGDGVAQGQQAGGDGRPGEVEGVAGGVEVGFELCGQAAIEGERDGQQVKAAGGRGAGPEGDVVELDGAGAEAAHLERDASEDELARPVGLRRLGRAPGRIPR